MGVEEGNDDGGKGNGDGDGDKKGNGDQPRHSRHWRQKSDGGNNGNGEGDGTKDMAPPTMPGERGEMVAMRLREFCNYCILSKVRSTKSYI